MTVQELIDHLETLPKDLPVYGRDTLYDQSWDIVHDVYIARHDGVECVKITA